MIATTDRCILCGNTTIPKGTEHPWWITIGNDTWPVHAECHLTARGRDAEIPETLEEITVDDEPRRAFPDGQLSSQMPFDLGGWDRDGFVVLPGLLATEVGERQMRGYEAEWLAAHTDPPSPNGWASVTPYMQYPALRELCCNATLAAVVNVLVGEPAAVHLNLTGWVSTERDWHQDCYLNPPEVGDRYAAVWIALGPIDVRSGPFECVPGSHRWPRIVREKLARFVDLADPAWPKHTEAFLTPLFERELRRRGEHPYRFAPAERGDVLIWQSRLWHRGSRPEQPGLERRALIAHYSGFRSDMPPMRDAGGGWYYPIENRT